jgi:hypothetical protein
MDLKGQTAVDTKLKSTHQNTVNTIRVFEEADGQVSSFSSKLYPQTRPVRSLLTEPQPAVLMAVLSSGLLKYYTLHRNNPLLGVKMEHTSFKLALGFPPSGDEGLPIMYDVYSLRGIQYRKTITRIGVCIRIRIRQELRL